MSDTTPPRWYSHSAVCRATGLEKRQLRNILDRGLVRFTQYREKDKRMLNAQTIDDLERLGVPVDRGILERGNAGSSGEI